MEAATPLYRHRVRILDQGLVIEHLTVEDACAADLARQRDEAGGDLGALITDAIEIGARVLSREQTAADTDFVRAEFERTAHEVEKQLTDRARELDEQFATRGTEIAAALAAHLEAAFGAETGVVTKALEQHFGEGSSQAVQHQVKAAVAEVTSKMGEDLVRQFTSGDASNPLADFKAATIRSLRDAGDQQRTELGKMTHMLTALQLEVHSLKAERETDEQVAAEAEKGTAKGRTYEDSVAQAVEALAVPQGDDALAVGDQADAGRAKTGDVVVTIGFAEGPGRGRIVFEAKTARLSRPAALRELDDAMAARTADFGVLVVPSEEKVPAKMLALREYNGNKLIVTYDPDEGGVLPLQVAYSLARARVLLNRGESGEVDAEAVAGAVERALQILEDVRRVKSSLTTSKKSIDTAAEIVSTMSDGVKAQLAEIAELVRPAAHADVDEGAPAAPPTVTITGEPADDGLF